LDVVIAENGPVLAIAGAGSGKTRTLTYRVAYLIESGIDPHRILLLTFTNKSAHEMVNRVESIMPCEVGRIWGGTFHHIANRILRVHSGRLGIDSNYTIMDQTDAHSLLSSCVQEQWQASEKEMLPHGSVLFNIISLARNTRCGIPAVIETEYPFFLGSADKIGVIADYYKGKKTKQNLLDFDDLLEMWLELMEGDNSLRDFYAERFQHILVDEYQDTNSLQSDIIDVLSSHHRNLMAVGDDCQSIYAFRGADFSNIIDFPKRYPDARIYKLEYNYRSSPEILKLANEIILCNQRQFRKVLQPVRKSMNPPLIVTPYDVYSQAEFVANRIQECIYNGISPSEIAVLYRAHFHSMELQMELSRMGTDFEVRSGIRFFEQAHIKDIVSYLRIIINPVDEVAWKRILEFMPGVGNKTSSKIFKHITENGNPIESCQDHSIIALAPKRARPYMENLCSMVTGLCELGPEAQPSGLIKVCIDNGYMDYMQSKYMDTERRREDINQFVEFASQYERPDNFLSDLALLTNSETEQTQDGINIETVKLSTIHQAKGLEWSVVFILCLTEGRFPNPKNIVSVDDEEEERRLFYVAVTRTKDQLYLCSPETMKDNNGNKHYIEPSRFLRQLSSECYNRFDW